MLKVRRKIFDVYAFPGVLKGHVWEIVGHDYCSGSYKPQFLIELPSGKLSEPLESMVSISMAIIAHYEKLFKEKSTLSL
ncbi:MAG: hypothetical protein ACK52F_00420 [bacterium]|jgi:hypothetical protein|uniref:Uncharacterized protein n=1 Tax=Bacteriophage sp. TaxID=38018 RepID=A0A7G9A4R8_9VIRU|nr:MAG: hypothetical protein [Bacteriophage sp.]